MPRNAPARRRRRWEKIDDLLLNPLSASEWVLLLFGAKSRAPSSNLTCQDFVTSNIIMSAVSTPAVPPLGKYLASSGRLRLYVLALLR